MVKTEAIGSTKREETKLKLSEQFHELLKEQHQAMDSAMSKMAPSAPVASRLKRTDMSRRVLAVGEDQRWAGNA